MADGDSSPRGSPELQIVGDEDEADTGEVPKAGGEDSGASVDTEQPEVEPEPELPVEDGQANAEAERESIPAQNESQPQPQSSPAPPPEDPESEANSPPSDDDKEPSPSPDNPLEFHSEPENSSDEDEVPPQERQDRADSHSSEDTQPDPSFDPNAVPEVSLRLGQAEPPHLHTNIQVSNHQSTWMNVDPPRNQRPRQPVNRISPEPPAKRMKLTVVGKKEDSKKKSPDGGKNASDKQKEEEKTKGKKGGKKKVEESEEEEETFELEFICAHRYKRKNRKQVIEYKVRWLGYGEDADTWEPESNILGDSAKEQVKIYWEEQKKKGVSKKPTIVKNAKRAASESATGSSSKPAEAAEESAADESVPKEPETEATASQSAPAIAAEPEVGNGFETINKHDWFGIREEDAKNKKAKREFKNLFVADRIPSLSEKLLAETHGAGRVTRSSLKPLKGDEPAPRASKTPEPPRRRRRQTVSPGIASATMTTTSTATTNRESLERSPTKRARKSLPVGKSIYTEISSSESPEADSVEPAPVPSRSPSPGPSTSTAMARKRASAVGAPPSRSIPKASTTRKSGTAVPTNIVTRQTRRATISRSTVSNSPQPSTSEAEPATVTQHGHDASQPAKRKSKPGIMDSDKYKDKHPEEVESSVSPGLGTTQLEESIAAGDDSIADDGSGNEGDETLVADDSLGEATDPNSSGESWPPETGPNGEILVLSNKHFENLRNVDLRSLFPARRKPGEGEEDETEEDKLRNSNPVQFDPSIAAKTVEELYEAAESLDVLRVFATFRVNTLFEKDLNSKDERGWTLLHRLAQTKCTEKEHPLCTIIPLVIQQGGCDASIVDEDGRTPLHIAVIAGNECAIKRFVDLGSPINTVDVNKKTPLISAIKYEMTEYVRILLLSGANFYRVNQYVEAHRDDIPIGIVDMLEEHRNRLVDAMDNARTHICTQATTGLKKTIQSSLMISPVFEKKVIEYEFKLNGGPIRAPNNYLLFEVGLLDMDTYNGDIKIRMWQQSPVQNILINDEEPVYMHKTTNYISMPKLVSGRNHVRIELMNQTYQGTRFCIISRVAHVFMLGYHRPNRMDPTIGNLMPLSMGNPPNGQARIVAPPAIVQMAVRLRPRYYVDPEVIRPQPPPPQNVQPIRQASYPIRRLPPQRALMNGSRYVNQARVVSAAPSRHHNNPMTAGSSSSDQSVPAWWRSGRDRQTANRTQYAPRLPRQMPATVMMQRRSSPPRSLQRVPSPPPRETPTNVRRLPPNVVQVQRPPPPRPTALPPNVVQLESVPSPRPVMPGGSFVTTTRTVRAEGTPTGSPSTPNPYHSTSPPPGPSNGNSPSTPPEDASSPRWSSPNGNVSRSVPNGFVAYRDVNRNRLMNPRMPLQGVRSTPRPLTAASNGVRPVVRQTQRFLNPSTSSFQRINPSSTTSTPTSTTNANGNNSPAPTLAPYHPLSFQPPGRRRPSSPPAAAQPAPTPPAPQPSRPTLEPMIP